MRPPAAPVPGDETPAASSPPASSLVAIAIKAPREPSPAAFAQEPSPDAATVQRPSPGAVVAEPVRASVDPFAISYIDTEDSDDDVDVGALIKPHEAEAGEVLSTHA